MNLTDCTEITYMNKKVYVVRKPVKNVVTKVLAVELHSRGTECFHLPYLLTPT